MSEQTRIELTGLDGSNPLAFLAALGTLRAIKRAEQRTVPRLHWTSSLRPTLTIPGDHTPDSLSNLLCDAVKLLEADGVAAFGDIVGVEIEIFRQFLKAAVSCQNTEAARSQLTFAAMYGSDAVIDAKKRTVVPTALSFSNGQGGKLLLKDFRTLASWVTPQKVHEALFEQWTYTDTGLPTFRWDPSDMRTGAHMATDPGTTETRSVLAANALAFIGLSFFPTVPISNRLQTSGLGFIDGEHYLKWPIWDCPLTPDTIFALLQQSQWPLSIGIITRFASRRLMYKKNLYLTPSIAD